MSRIGVWKRNYEDANKRFKEIRWDNTKGANRISIVYDGMWSVYEWDVFGTEIKLNEFSTKDKAMKFARGYMRENPQG